MAKILIIFGSTGGNTELVVDEVAGVLRKSHDVRVQRVEKSLTDDFRRHDLIVLACPTYGHGILQDQFQPFAKAMRDLDLKGMRFAVIGLGDPKYEREYHIESANILEALVKERGGALVTGALRISRNPVLYLGWHINKWAEDLSAKLKSVPA